MGPDRDEDDEFDVLGLRRDLNRFVSGIGEGEGWL